MSPQTITYKTVGTLPINLDLYLPAQANNLPILLWFHGGGLLQGKRTSVAPHMLSGVTKHQYALVSADYRLAPQATAAEILTDVQDCLTFIYNQLPEHVDDGTLDVSRIAVSGSSAGGYLALLAGLYPTKVKPKAILAIYPITDPWGHFFTTPQRRPEHIDRSTVAEFLDRDGPVVSCNDPTSARGKMYGYMMQEANLASLLVVPAHDDTFIVAKQIRKRAAFDVPCFVVHGDADAFVGVEQADEVVEALREVGATVEYERLPGLDHLFDKDEKYEMESMYRFLGKYV